MADTHAISDEQHQLGQCKILIDARRNQNWESSETLVKRRGHIVSDLQTAEIEMRRQDNLMRSEMPSAPRGQTTVGWFRFGSVYSRYLLWLLGEHEQWTCLLMISPGKIK